MAEFSLGLTKTAVEGTLSLVKSAIEEEKKLRETVQNDLVFITGEFEVMQSFLQDANREHARNGKVTLTLVRQLRTLAFDVEDCVEYVIHLDLDKSSIWGGLRRLWQTVNCCALPLPLDIAVAEIKQLKARVEDVSERNTRYSHTLHGSADNNKKQQPVTVMPLPAEDATTTIFGPSSAAFHALRDAWKATGKWSTNMCNLDQELLITREGDHDLRVISIWGSGSSGGGGDGGAGPGMASILTEAYYDPEICEKFKVRAWVKLTHPFNHDEFVKSLLAQFYESSFHQANAEFVEDNLVMRAKKAMMQEMRRQRYLVVLEDVLTVAEWDVIRRYLPDSKNDSRILVSTPQLGIALLCTREPYQVSELRNFSSDNQFLCAFSKKEKTPSDIGEFYRQLLQGHGVISVWGADDNEKSNLIDILYKGIINGWLEEIEGVPNKSDHVDMLYKGISNRRRKLERHGSWVDVPTTNLFDLKVFARHLFLNFHSDDIRASKITEGGKMEKEGLLMEWCRESLFEKDDCIVVINGLRSMEDWELIKSTFFPSKATTAKAGCIIIVVTNEETVAKHCVKDHTHLACNATYLKADPTIDALIKKGCWQYAIRGKKGRLFYDRREDAQEWDKKFKDVGGTDLNEGEDEEEGFRVFGVTNVKGNYVKSVLRHAYYGALNQQQIERRRCSWVDMPDGQFDLRDFCWRLLLDFYSDDPYQVKEEVAIGLMEGTIDPIEKCCWILRNEKCLVVIDGQSSWEEDWDSIKRTFFSDEQHIQSIIIVGSAMRISREQDFYDTTKALRLDTQLGHPIYMKYLRTLSTQERYQEVIQWAERRCPPVGRGSEVLSLIWSLVGLYDDQSSFSVWGIPGVGISTVVKTAYNYEIIRSSGLGIPYNLPLLPDEDIPPPTEAFAWVDIPSPFNLTEIVWRLFLNFFFDDPQAKETATVRMMKKGHQVPTLECCKILRTRKCLVVMDGLRSKQDWDSIKATFLAERIEGKIIVITNDEEVAMHCVQNDEGRTMNITRLEANAALSLFEKIASEAERSKGLTTSEKMELSNYVGKCGGLPKVIAAICNSVRMLDSLRYDFMSTLATHPEFHGLRPLFSWMQSYFDACSDSIKPCIFYLSIFDAEKNIRLRRLLWRWIAEGYCRDTSDGRTCEENGEKFISDLIKLSIIQESVSSQVYYQINGLFHEYIISRPMEDNLVFLLEGRCSLNSTRVGQHLTIRSSWDRRDRIVYESIDFSRLRSLTIFGEWKSFFICSSKNVNRMRLLRVLDLEDAEGVTNEDLEQIAKLLTRLKFLSLRGCGEITRLPSSMGGLRQLQTLDIRGTSIVTLPLFMTKLQKLQYIRAGTATSEAWDWEEGEVDRASSSTQEGDVVSTDGEEEDRASSSAQAVTNVQPLAAATPKKVGTDTTALLLPPDWSCTPNLVSSLLSKLCSSGSNGGDKVPAGIQKLAFLHTLGVVNVNVTSSAKSLFEALKQQHLTQLRKLGVSGINKGNIKEFCEAISDLAHLTSLSVEVDKDGDLDDNIPELPKTIKSLKLYGRVNKLLVWIGQLGYNNLEKLKVDLTIENPGELQALDRLSTRHVGMGHLRIRPIQEGDLHLGGGWSCARVVEIQCSSVLHIKFDDDAFLLVEVLKVHFSGGSLKISGLSELRYLKEVWLKGYTDAQKQYMQQQINDMKLAGNQERPVLKLVQPCVSSGTNSTSEPEAQANASHPHGRTAGLCLPGVLTCCAHQVTNSVIVRTTE